MEEHFTLAEMIEYIVAIVKDPRLARDDKEEAITAIRQEMQDRYGINTWQTN
jgi:hypothetical protein